MKNFSNKAAKAIVNLRAAESSVSLLNKSTFLNESGESIIQCPVHKDGHFVSEWIGHLKK